ncbi:MAG TPA: lipid-binding SYLF domain-containing protein [Gammaproteobacteria bacterium]|nr:lipid-binding SYLF domain-containing protein [Gammaproteobacteria bacterium]
MKTLFRMTAALVLAAALGACTTTGYRPGENVTPAAQPVQDPQIAETIASFKNKDPSMAPYFHDAYGYAVFPTIGKGGFVVGGAYGTGKVYVDDELIGLSSITQATIGLQMGGQTYSEIVFFKDAAALNQFKQGGYELSAQASAVAVTSGAAANANYSNGVAIFTLTKAGLMYEASVGGQKFSFTPI